MANLAPSIAVVPSAARGIHAAIARALAPRPSLTVVEPRLGKPTMIVKDAWRR